jgi:fatty-acyl-CoA synthase
MSPQKTPNLWFAVDKFPLTGSGKIQKFILKNNYLKNKNNFNEIQQYKI